MRREERLVKTALSLVTAGVLVCAGCGFKDKPVSPQQVLPQAVPDLRVKLNPQGATLSWSYPQKTITGEAVEEIDGFELFQAEIPEDDFCPSCPIPYRTVIDVDGGYVVPGSTKTAVYEVRGLRPGNLYYFKVRSKSGWWRESKDSNEISFLWQTPPRTPQSLSVLSGDGENTLQWQPVTELTTGEKISAPLQYRIFRGVDGAGVAPYGSPLTTSSYRDTGVKNGSRYTYQVQAENIYTHGTIVGPLSEPVFATPTDQTAPPVVSQIAAMRTEMGVKVFWEDVSASDLAGYRVYRRHAGEAPVQVGEVSLPYTLFVDQNPPSGLLYYSVSSFDDQDPANESKRSVEARAE
nr:fibronectin type III domain-containing protein [uncultured Desulfobulbus sp.]